MTQNPKMIRADTKLTDAQKLMEQFKVNSLLVSNPKEELIGIVQIYDLGI
jgi:arabinose-5-phosphate isomerase